MSKDLRVEINKLVKDLNTVIEASVHDANKEAQGETGIHYVDVNPRFNIHRWCEQGKWHEPAPDIDSTYFFLSSWKDVSIPESRANTDAVDQAEVKALISQGNITLPSDHCGVGMDPRH
jgi:hypothetical protein